jgi:hypothetical protein
VTPVSGASFFFRTGVFELGTATSTTREAAMRPSQRAGERAGPSADAVRLHRWLGSGNSKNATTPRAHIINAGLGPHVPLDGPDVACPLYKTLIGSPLMCAKPMLVPVLAEAGSGLRLNKHLEHDDGELVFRHACKLGLEGIVSKRLGSRYRSSTGLEARGGRELGQERMALT